MSWGWVLFLTPFYFVGNVVLGLDAVLITKFAGLLLASTSTLLIYYLVLKFTGTHYVAIAIAALVSLEPTWVFLRISGMEGVLLTTLILASAITLLETRWLATGLLLGAAFWTRPEAGLYVVVAAGAGFLSWFVWWDNRQMVLRGLRTILITPPRELLRRLNFDRQKTAFFFRGTRPMGYLIGPPALAVILWIGYNYWISGEFYSNSYLVRHDATLPLIPIDNMLTVWNRGIGDFQAWVGGWRLVVGAPIIIGVSLWLIRERGILVIGLVLFAPLLVFGVASGISFGDGPFNFFARRFVDPAIPVILMLLLVGIWLLITEARTIVFERYPTRGRRVSVLFPLYLVITVFLVTSVLAEIETQSELTEDYSWNSRNVFDADELTGQWLKRHAPEDASVLVADAGAIRYFGELATVDGAGINSHENIGLPIFQIAIDQKPDYIAIWEDGIWDALPNATKVARFGTPRNTILGGSVVGIYQLDWSRTFNLVATPVTAPENKTVIDMIDLGIRKSETDHDHSITFVSFSPEAIGAINDVDMREIGIAHGGSVQEFFELRTVPGRPLDLILRYRVDALPATAEVTVNGNVIGELELDAAVGQLAETTIHVPGEQIVGSLSRFDINWRGFVSEFRWWTVDAGEGILILPDIDPDASPETIVSPLAGLPAPEGAIAFDRFEVENGAPTDLRVPDTIKNGRWWISVDPGAEFGILNGRLVEASLDATQDHRMVINARSPDVTVGADIEWTGSSAGLVARHDGEVNGSNWIMVWYTGDTRQILLGRSVEGIFTLLGTETRDWGPEGSIRRLELSTSGEDITVTLDGTVILTADDDMLVENTYVGVFAKGETVTSWDNFSIVPTEVAEAPDTP